MSDEHLKMQVTFAKSLSIKQLKFDGEKFAFNMPIQPIVAMRRRWGLAEMARDPAAGSNYAAASAMDIAKNVGIEATVTYILYKGKTPIGMCSFHHHNEREATSDMDSVYIEPEYRRKGVGSWFVSEVMKVFTKDRVCQAVKIRCHGPWLPKFYRRLGFEATDTYMRWEIPAIKDQ